MITFSFSPMRWSRFPRTAASVRTRVVFWNDAADGREERVRIERGFGDPEEDPVGVCFLGFSNHFFARDRVDVFDLAVARDHLLDAVIFALEPESVHDLAGEERRIAGLLTSTCLSLMSTP